MRRGAEFRPSEPGEQTARPLDSRIVLRVTLVVLALPFLATFVALVAARDAAPLNHDVALIELPTGDVLGGDLPLVGSYERFGGNQPGPWLFWILAVPSLVGPIGIGVATLTIGYGAIAGMLRGARPSWPWCSPADAPGRWRW